MFTIIVYPHLFKLSGKGSSVYLKEVSLHPRWISLFPRHVSLGYDVDNEGCEHHYIDRMVNRFTIEQPYGPLSYIMNDILFRGYDFCMYSSDDSPPVSQFEPWNLPGNQETAMALGYMEAPNDYYVCLKAGCIPSDFGAWRAYPPLI